MYVIDDSTITWEMIEEDMQKEYSIQLKTGPKRLAERIGKGKGFLSRIYRLDFDWEIEGNLSANDRKPPEKCALKVSTLDVIKELFDNVGSGQKKHLAEYYAASLSNNELFFYQNIAKLGFDELRIPKYYCGREYSEETGIGYLAMEIMEGSIVQHIYENLSGKQILEILYQMALLNGSSLYHTEQLQSFIDSKFFDQFLEDFNTKDKTTKGIHRCMENFPKYKEKLEILLPVAEIFVNPKVYRELRKRNCRIDLLCQGDLWPPNVMWNHDSKDPENKKLKAILDWQQVHLGNPLEDLVKWLSLSIDPEKYKNSITKFLAYYYENLLKFAGDRLVPWKDFEEFQKCYELMYVWQTALYCPIVANTGDLIFEGIKDEKTIAPLRKVYHEKFLVMIDESVELIEKWKHEIFEITI